MARTINRERFTAAVAALRSEPVQARLVDVLLPLRAELVTLRGEGRSYLELWRVVEAADVECTYTAFLRAVKQVLEDRVTPLAAARARKRARRTIVRGLPTVPVALREPMAMPAMVGAAAYGDPYQAAATRSVATALVAAFGGSAAETKT